MDGLTILHLLFFPDNRADWQVVCDLWFKPEGEFAISVEYRSAY